MQWSLDFWIISEYIRFPLGQFEFSWRGDKELFPGNSTHTHTRRHKKNVTTFPVYRTCYFVYVSGTAIQKHRKALNRYTLYVGNYTESQWKCISIALLVCVCLCSRASSVAAWIQIGSSATCFLKCMLYHISIDGISGCYAKSVLENAFPTRIFIGSSKVPMILHKMLYIRSFTIFFRHSNIRSEKIL